MILNAVVFYTVVIYYAHCLVGSLLFHFPNLIPFWRHGVKLKNVVVVNIAALVLVLASCNNRIFCCNSCSKWLLTLGVSVDLWQWSCCQVLLLAAQFWVKAGVLRTATGPLPPPTPPCCPELDSSSRLSPGTPKWTLSYLHYYMFHLRRTKNDW